MDETTLLSDEQRALLVAALSDDGTAVLDAWQYWRRHSNLDTLPGDQFPLLPKLYANLVRFGLTAGDSGDAGRLKGIYRRAWVRTQQQLALAEALLPQLTAAGVVATLIGDAAVALDLYPVRGERAIERLTCLIDDVALAVALAALRSAGWELEGDPAPLTNPALRRWLSAARFQRDGQPGISLCWRITPTSPALSRTPAVSGRCVDHMVAPPRVSRACQALLAGAQVMQGSPARLIATADLGMALRVLTPGEWDALLEAAAWLQLARPFAAALGAVAPLLEVTPPPQVAARLDALGAGEPRYARRPATGRALASLAGRLGWHVEQWRRLAAINDVRPTLGAWVEYLQAVSGAGNVGELPARLVGKLAG